MCSRGHTTATTISRNVHLHRPNLFPFTHCPPPPRPRPHPLPISEWTGRTVLLRLAYFPRLDILWVRLCCSLSGFPSFFFFFFLSFLFKARPYSTVGMGRVGLALAPRWTRVPLSSCERHCCEHGCTGLLPCRVFAIGGSAGSLRRCPDAAPPAVHGRARGYVPTGALMGARPLLPTVTCVPNDEPCQASLPLLAGVTVCGWTRGRR